MPWQTAAHMNLWGPGVVSGLDLDWGHYGRVWLNPPYGDQTFIWMKRFAEHKRGIALIFARTDTRGFHEHIFNSAKAIYFIKSRVKFHREDGSCPKNGPAAASCLVAHSDEDVAAILNSGVAGFMMRPYVEHRP